MTSLRSAAFALLAGAVFLSPAQRLEAKELRLKVLQGIPEDKGQWEVKVESMTGKAVQEAKRMLASTSLSVCTDITNEVASRNKWLDDDDDKATDGKCDSKIEENTRRRARMKIRCGKQVTRATITRTQAKKFRISVVGKDENGDDFDIKMSYAYQGKCTETGSSVSSMKLNPEVCKTMKQQLSQVTTAQSCDALPEAQRAACKAQMEKAMAQFKAMCP